MFGTDIIIQGGPFVEARFYRHETNQMPLSPIFFSKEGFKKELSNCLNDAGKGKERSIQPVSELL